MQKHILGVTHPDTLMSTNNVAEISRAQGKTAEAAELENEMRFHSDHPGTVSTSAGLASIYWEQGEWDETAKLVKQLLEARKVILGEANRETLQAKSASSENC
jgi:hypothetical protein